MNNTPTPRTDAIIGKLVGAMISPTDAKAALSFRKEIAQLEQELNEVKEYAAGQRVLASAINDAATEMVKERDQLRKVVDELAAVVRGEFGNYNWRVSAYNKLPHVIERKTK